LCLGDRGANLARRFGMEARESGMSEANGTFTIDVVSDVVCPWCYLGEKRLETALAEEPQPLTVRWRPYQLDPTIPEGGVDRAEYMEKKFGKSGRLQTVHDNLVRLGAEVGLSFAFDRIKRAPNTLDAHRVIRWSAATGAQGKVVDRLFRAYFIEGRDIGERSVLVEIASECGLDAAIVDKLLAEGADVDTVRQEIAEAQELGISGVPFFIFADRLAVAGAQDVSVLRRAIAQAREAMREAPAA
jgi:predicted DsbA family dithiol-disulfide isomerase